MFLEDLHTKANELLIISRFYREENEKTYFQSLIWIKLTVFNRFYENMAKIVKIGVIGYKQGISLFWCNILLGLRFHSRDCLCECVYSYYSFFETI